MTEYISSRNEPTAPAVVIHSVKGCSLASVPVVSAVYRAPSRWAWSSSMMLASG